MENRKTRLKIINIKRFVFFVTFLLFIVAAVLAVSIFASDSDKPLAEEKTIHIVTSGDTLWDISMNNKGEKDIRTYVYLIKKLNNLESSDLQIGMKIKLP